MVSREWYSVPREGKTSNRVYQFALEQGGVDGLGFYCIHRLDLVDDHLAPVEQIRLKALLRQVLFIWRQEHIQAAQRLDEEDRLRAIERKKNQQRLLDRSIRERALK